MDSIAGWPAMFCIDPSLEGGQQSAEWEPAPQCICLQVMLAKAGWTARSTTSARATVWRTLFMTTINYGPLEVSRM
jgi:hypothetical protein